MLLDLDRFNMVMLSFTRAMCPAKRDREYDQQAFNALAMGNMSIFKIKSTVTTNVSRLCGVDCSLI